MSEASAPALGRLVAGTKPATSEDQQAHGRRVTVVSDRVNGVPALARADVGIAIDAGNDVAMESADVVLASDDPRAVVGGITLSGASYRTMRRTCSGRRTTT